MYLAWNSLKIFNNRIVNLYCIKMGNGMTKILPGLYLGSIRDSTDNNKIQENEITHIISVHDNAKPGKIEKISYLCFDASDTASEDLERYFVDSINFIHSARLNNGNVLVHCLAGVSRSATLVISYIMVVTSLPWYDSMNAVRGARSQVNPNFGFQRQLQNFEFTKIKEVRKNLFDLYGTYDHGEDLKICKDLLEKYQKTQNELNRNSDNEQQINKTLKTYPLAFNAYNLDKNKVKNNVEKVKDMRRGETRENQNKTTEQNKKEVLKKIFGED